MKAQSDSGAAFVLCRPGISGAGIVFVRNAIAVFVTPAWRRRVGGFGWRRRFGWRNRAAFVIRRPGVAGARVLIIRDTVAVFIIVGRLDRAAFVFTRSGIARAGIL